MLAFVRVVEEGSFGRAAARLGISKSIVSRRLARLESRLGTQLLTRNAHGAIPTHIGTDYFRRLSAIFGEIEAANEAVGAATSEIAGEIRLTASLSFGIEHLAPVLAAFLQRHPKVALDLVLEDRRTDLLAEHFDLAIRIGALPDSSLIARRLAPIHAVAVASPAYLAARGRPAEPADLARHDVLLYSNAGPGTEWRFARGGKVQKCRVTSRVRVNNGDAIREMARTGLGIALLPTFIASKALADRSLEVILRDWTLGEYGLYAVMPPGRAGIARVRALVDHLAASFGPEPKWDPCWAAAKERERKPRGKNAKAG